MKWKLNAFRFSDRTFEIGYKMGWFETTDKIDVEASIENIMHLKSDIDDETEPFEKVEIFIDGKKRMRVFAKVKEGIDIAFNAENLPILVGVRIIWVSKH